MQKSMTSRERMEALVHNEPVDRIPVALWKHFPVDDQDPNKLAAATIQFQKTFEFDFVKVSPASSFCVKDWGAVDAWQGNPEGTREYQDHVIHTPDDWTKLGRLDPKAGSLGQQLECLKIIRDQIGTDFPIIQTIFSPLSQAKNLIGKTNLFTEIRKNPDALKNGLETITASTADFIAACKEIGIDGIFFAVQHASHQLLSNIEFEEFGKAYDKQLFPLINEFWLNVIHIHGLDIMDEMMRDYPMQIFNWHDRDTFPNLKEGKKIFNKIECGGLGRINTMLLGAEKAIQAEIDDAIQQTGGNQFVLGTGCVMMQTTPYGNIKSAVNYLRSIPV